MDAATTKHPCFLIRNDSYRFLGDFKTCATVLKRYKQIVTLLSTLDDEDWNYPQRNIQSYREERDARALTKQRLVHLAACIIHLPCAKIALAVAHASRSFSFARCACYLCKKRKKNTTTVRISLLELTYLNARNSLLETAFDSRQQRPSLLSSLYQRTRTRSLTEVSSEEVVLSSRKSIFTTRFY